MLYKKIKKYFIMTNGCKILFQIAKSTILFRDFIFFLRLINPLFLVLLLQQ